MARLAPIGKVGSMGEPKNGAGPTPVDVLIEIKEAILALQLGQAATNAELAKTNVELAKTNAELAKTRLDVAGLADAVLNGFARTDERLAVLARTLDSFMRETDRRFDRLDGAMRESDRRFDRLEEKLGLSS